MCVCWLVEKVDHVGAKLPDNDTNGNRLPMLPSEFEDLKVAIIPAIIGLMGSVDATCVHVVDGDGVFFHVCGVWVDLLSTNRITQA
jgi:hypothetical protein